MAASKGHVDSSVAERRLRPIYGKFSLQMLQIDMKLFHP